MQYFGGKSRICKQVAGLINWHTVHSPYVEPFVGGANVIGRVSAPVRIASDTNAALITLWQRLAEGWIPPQKISEAVYREMSTAQNPDNPLTAFVGFGCSFGAKWFGGYARGAHNYAGAARKSLLSKQTLLSNVIWKNADYRSLPLPKNSVIYCDPPYAGTTGYNCGPFDSRQFWAWVRAKEGEGHTVFVSEYTAPPDFEVVLEIPVTLSMRSSVDDCEARTERVFRLKKTTQSAARARYLAVYSR